jgi:RND superfamily putative drug exporter
MGSVRPKDRPTRGRGLLGRVGGFAARRPWLTLGFWVVLLVVLASGSQGLEKKISTEPIFTKGSTAERAHELALREFGGEEAMVLMLRGPGPAVDRQGQRLVERLQRLPETVAISPWNSQGSIQGLRPRPEVAAILVSIGKTPQTGTQVVPAVERQIDATVRAPVEVSVAGGPAVVASLRDAIKRAGTFGELLAAPFLLLILLFVFRSVLPAAMPLLVGGLVVGASKGTMGYLADLITIDPIGIAIAGMFGLALGVDYSLLVVSRFREELENGGEVKDVVRETVVATGRSIVPAGCGLVLAMFVSLLVIPGTFVASFTLAVIAATVLSMFSALLAMPALLTLLGSRLDRWALPRRRQGGSVALGWSRQIARRPGVVLGLLFLLMAAGAWAFTLDTNSGSVKQLPPDDPGRLAQEDIERELGPGWTAPFEVVMDGGDQPVTTNQRLEALASFQRRVERDPGVEAMAGFAGLESTTKQLNSAEGNLVEQERGMKKLDQGLAGVEKGSEKTEGGFAEAAGGAGRLATAIGETKTGSGALANGLESSAEGSAKLSDGLDKASEGTGKLAHGTSELSTGSGKLAESAAKARKQTAEAVGSSRTLKSALDSGEESLQAAPLTATEEQLAAAWGALQRMGPGRGDPQFAAALEAVRQATRELTGLEPGEESEGEPAEAGVAADVQRALNQFNLGLYLVGQQDENARKASEGVDKLADAAAKLDRGVRKLSDSSGDLSEALVRLSHGGGELPPGLRKLSAGAEKLLGGLGRLETGAGGLAGGLSEGAQQSQRLTGAVNRLHAGTEESGSEPSVLVQSPGIFKSGYFALAGLDGSRPERRNQAGLLINLAGGGNAARMVVIGTDPLASDDAAETGKRLEEDAADLAEQTNSEVLVGGLSPNIVSLNEVFREQAPWARLALSIVTLLVLIPVTRSLLLPIIAALLNLLTVSATFGVLAFLFDTKLIGGPGFVDTSVLPVVVILTLGLAIDYEVFLFARIREEYLRTGSTREAIDQGLKRTAHVISGAAVIMMVVFLAFAVTPLAAIRDISLAIAISVFIDAFIVRFAILPATMRALGDRCWWLPRWLDRIVPGRAPERAAVEA